MIAGVNIAAVVGMLLLPAFLIWPGIAPRRDHRKDSSNKA